MRRHLVLVCGKRVRFLPDPDKRSGSVCPQYPGPELPRGVRYLFLNADRFAEAVPGSGRIENVEFSDVKVHKLPWNTQIKEYPD